MSRKKKDPTLEKLSTMSDIEIWEKAADLGAYKAMKRSIFLGNNDYEEWLQIHPVFANPEIRERIKKGQEEELKYLVGRLTDFGADTLVVHFQDRSAVYDLNKRAKN